MCVDDENAISKKTSFINCTGHPIMHRTPNTIRGCVKYFAWVMSSNQIKYVSLLGKTKAPERRPKLTLRVCYVNRPLPSSTNPHFQNDARYTNFLVKMSFICMRMKNNFHIKGWHLPSFWNRGPGELGNGLFTFAQESQCHVTSDRWDFIWEIEYWGLRTPNFIISTFFSIKCK